MEASGENFLLIVAILLFAAVMAGKVAYRFGAPALLFFLGAGILFGVSLISFDSIEAVQFVGMIALCVILFTGGMDTKSSEIRPIIAPGLVLVTVGVALTALAVGAFVYFIAPWLGIQVSFLFALLLAATMASTDSASVFSILRSKKQGLQENLRPLLEFESGSNDPVAYILTILLVGIISNTSTDASAGAIIIVFMIQMIVGAVCGYLVGRFGVMIINRINLDNSSLYTVLLLSVIFFSFAFTHLLHGNGYLAVYLSGLVIGNRKIVHKRQLTIFFDGFTWLFQIFMFLTLGLFVNLEELLQPEVLILGAIVGGFLILVARPLAVFLCMAPFRKFSLKARLFVSWVGLRGAVPIIFATYPLIADIPDARLLFNIVFMVTIISLVVQGTTVGAMAKLLGLSYKEKETSFGVNMQDNIKSEFTEIVVNDAMLQSGKLLKHMSLPTNTLVMMVYRDNDYFIPHGDTEFCIGDKLLVVTDRNEELADSYKNMGVDDIMKLR